MSVALFIHRCHILVSMFGLSQLFADAVLLTCMYHFKQPEASNSSNTVSAILPHQLCCHGECMPFCVVAMGTQYYSPPLAPIMFVHVHLYASCALMLKKNVSSTGECPEGLPSVGTCPGIPDAVSADDKNTKNAARLARCDFACLTVKMSDI